MKCESSLKKQLNHPRRHAFTLVEMLLVLTILAILAGLILPRIAGKGQQARVDATKTQIGLFKTALNMFEVDNGYYPKGKNGLQDLLTQPRNAPNWHGPYLDTPAMPLDQWQHPYIYECPGRHNPSSYDISSPGPDGQAGNEDDIGNWQQPGK
jgi:general secretion pathway protein G